MTTPIKTIFGDLFSNPPKINFGTAAVELAQDVESVFVGDAALNAVGGEVLSNLKQAASNAISLADTEIGSALAGAVPLAEGAFEAFLAKMTGGLSVPFNPFVSSGIDQGAAALKAVIDAAALKAKAAAAQVQLPSSGVIGSLNPLGALGSSGGSVVGGVASAGQ